MALVLTCRTCGQRQRDRRGYRDHLLREHNEVARRGFDAPVRLEGRELAAVWAGIRRRQMTSMTTANRRREELGLPRVSDWEAAGRREDNRARSARQLRAAARARGVATAALGTPVVPLVPQPAATPMMALRLGTFQARPLAVPAGTVRQGGARLPRSPCPRCTTCPCQTTRDFSGAQHPASAPPHRPMSPIRPPSPRRPHTRSPKPDPSPGPPQLSREEPQPEEKEGQLSWADAQEQFSLGAEAMSQGSGSPVAFLDATTCEDILADIRRPDGTLPDFGSIPSEPESPPPALELEVTHSDRVTQTELAPSRDQATQVLSRPHRWTSATKTPALTSTTDQTTQVLLRPRQSWAFTQTERPATSTSSSWTQVPRVDLTDTATDMPPVLVTSTSCQAGAYFNNDEIPPGVPRPRLPWAYSYAQFGALLTAYPDVHPR